MSPTKTRFYELSKVGSYRNFVVKEKELPTLKATEVLVKIHAVSLQHRDLDIANGTYFLHDLPSGLVPCSDMAGEVFSVGEDVKEWKSGDRVCANFSPDHLFGAHSQEKMELSLGGGKTDGVLMQYRTFQAHSLVEIPKHLSYEEASTLPCAALTAYNALYGGPIQIKAGDHVLLLGTGGVSIVGLQFALAAGAVPIITSSSDEKLEVAKKLGARHIINYTKTEKWDEEVHKITNGRGVDHVLEVAGSTVHNSLCALKEEGSIHFIGLVSQESTKDTLYKDIIAKGANARGVRIGSVALFKDMNRLITANPEVTRPVINKIFPFEEAIDAYAYLESQKHIGKVVIRIS